MTPDPDKLRLYAFTLFSKLEGAVTSGMVHLGDRLGLYRALADAGTRSPASSSPSARGSTSAGSGRPYNQAAANSSMPADPTGTSGSRCPPKPWRCWPTRTRRRSAWASSCLLPASWPPWRTCPRRSGPGSATTTTATARTVLPGSSGPSSRGTGTTCSRGPAGRDGVVPRLEAGASRRTSAAERGYGLPDGRGLPVQRDPRLRHLPAGARAAGPAARSWVWPTPGSTTPARSRSPLTARSTW